MKNNVKVKQKHLVADDKLSVYFIIFYLNRRVGPCSWDHQLSPLRQEKAARLSEGEAERSYFILRQIDVLFMESQPTDKRSVNYTVLEHRNIKSTDFYLIGSFRVASAHLPCLLHRFTICEVCVNRWFYKRTPGPHLTHHLDSGSISRFLIM